MRLLNILAVLLTVIVTTGCPGPKPKRSQSKIIHIKGDPMAFLKDRSINGKATIARDRLDMNGYFLMVPSGFVNQAKVDDLSYEKQKAEQDPSRNRFEEKKQSFYRFEKRGQEVALRPMTGDGMALIFAEDREWLRLTHVEIKGQKLENQISFKTLHSSSSPDGRRHSILVLAQENGAKELVSLNIIQAHGTEEKIVKSNVPYEYLAGRGKKVGWNAKLPLEVEFCDNVPESLYQSFVRAWSDWQEPLRGRLELVPKKSKECPPFSDVNTRTFSYVTDWIEIPGESATMGITTNLMDPTRPEIVDSDVFIFSQEVQEVLDSKRPGKKVFDSDFLADSKVIELFYSTTLHELGHLLGLHHVFNGTRSIMSYDDERSLTSYDREAVQELYPIDEDVQRRPPRHRREREQQQDEIERKWRELLSSRQRD